MIADLQTLITNRLSKLEEEQAEAKTQKEMVVDALANDEELISLEEKLKEARQRYNLHKEAILNEPENRAVIEKLKDINQEIKDLKAMLSGELLGYYKQEDSLVFEAANGKIYKFGFSAKVKETDQLPLPIK